MKRVKKLLVTILSVVMMVTTLTACTGESTSKLGKGKDVLTIHYWLSGMGEQWLIDMIEAFEAEYPEYTVEYQASARDKALTSAFGMEDLDEADLYLVTKTDAIEYLEPLDDILESTAPGDKKPLKDKFKGNYLDYEQSADGHYYSLSYGGGMIGFYYNKKLFEEANITQLPRTTDELTVLCDTFNSKKITPMCHFKKGGYYEYMLQLYLAQYNGMDYYLNNFWACTDANGKSPSKEILTAKDGRYYAVKAMEKFITPAYTLTGSITQSHTEMQTMFLNGSAAMMVNGSWIENEMKNTKDDSVVGVMKMPVLSAIVDRLTTVKMDTDLRKLITAIDQVTEGEKQLSDFASGDGYVIDGLTVSAEDWKIVEEARNLITCNYGQESAYIPNYAEEKEGAKKFLQFLYSDKGYEIYCKATKCPLPLELSTGEDLKITGISEAQQAQFDWLSANAMFVDKGYSKRNEIFITGGANEMAGINYVDKLCAGNSDDRMNADEIWALLVKTVDDNYESKWLPNMQER